MDADAELLRRYVEDHSEAAFTELVRRHLNLVYFAALRQVGGDAHTAEEVAQAVFTDLARKAASLCQRPVLASWLHTSTHFAATKARRAEWRRNKYESEAQNMPDFLHDAASTAEWERLRPTIDGVIHELNETDREAVLQRFFEGRTFGEIGAALHLSEDAARMRVDRALEKLHHLLSRRGITSTSAALGVVLANQAAATAPAGLVAGIASAALSGFALTGAGSVAASWISFMSTSKFTTSAAVMALFVALSVGVYEIRNGRMAGVALAADRREVYVLAMRVGEAERQAKAAMRFASQAQPSTVGQLGKLEAAVEPEKEQNGPFGPEPPGSRARGRALLAAYPEIKQLLIQDTRARFSAMYQRLYQELGLTDAQVEAFELIMISGVSSGYGAMNKNETVTLEPAPALPPGEKDARLRQLLGERGFQRLEEFQRSPGDFRVVQLASALYFTDSPLTAEQAAQLHRVLAEGNRAHRDQPPAEYWAGVRAQAGTFLSEPQLAALGGLQASDEFNFARQQNQRLRTATGPGNPKS